MAFLQTVEPERQRMGSALPALPGNGILERFGICSYSKPFTARDIAAFNTALDPLFTCRIDQPRAYVHVDELHALGLFQRLLSQPIRNILFSIMPDPVLYHCHVNEIAANDSKPNLFPETLSGWHRDGDSELLHGEITHVSLFVYFTEVGPQDGAFEFVPKNPAAWLHSLTPVTSVTGSPGFAFAWQRSFYHRGSPNRGAVRRRVFKISVQRNRFVSSHLKNPHFRALLPLLPAGDTALDILLGRYQGCQAPRVSGIHTPRADEIEPTGHLDIPNIVLAKHQLRRRASRLKAFVLDTIRATKAAAY